MNQHLDPENLSDEELAKIIAADPRLVAELAKRDFEYFFDLFFKRYKTSELAPFHREFFKIVQDDSIKRAFVLGFRGCGKSTILNTAAICYGILALSKKHIVIASQTQQQARGHMRNVREEVALNPLLKKLFGPFAEGTEEWSASQLVIPAYGATIVAMSVEEGKRGSRFGPHRPDFIIIDDVEDLASTKTSENREKTFDWLVGEAIPLGDENTRIFFLANMLHPQAALLKIEKLIVDGVMPGIAMRVPFLNEDGTAAWPQRFPTPESVEEFRRSRGDDLVWERDYLLKATAKALQIIKMEDIHFYDYGAMKDSFHQGWGGFASGLDPAISKKESADYTAIVTGKLLRGSDKPIIYIQPDIVNLRMNFSETLDMVKAIKKQYDSPYHYFYIEATSYQRALVEELQRQSIEAIPMHGLGDKEARLHIVSRYIRDGTIQFPLTGCEKLLDQLVYFGSELHDDLADAFAYLVLGMLGEMDSGSGQVFWI